MISQTAEYALRAAVFLAERNQRSHTIQEIARATMVPAGYLAKVMRGLARAGLVHSQRGVRGGFTLEISAEQLTIYAIVQAVDPIQRITRCPLNNRAHADELCALHRRLDDAAALIEKSFRESSLADLITQPTFLDASAESAMDSGTEPHTEAPAQSMPPPEQPL